LGKKDQRVPFLVVFVLRMLSVFLTQSLMAQQPSSLYNQALAQLRAGDFAAGCTTAAKVVQREPGHYAALNLLGVCAVQRGDGAKGETYFRKSLALNPRYVEALVNLGVNHLQRGKPQAAIAQFREALKLEPNNATALYQLGKGETLTGDTSNAITHLQRARELSPNDVQISLALARSFIVAGQPEAAGKLVEPMLAKDQPSQVLLPTILIALDAGQDGMARQAVEKLLRQDPQPLPEILAAARGLSAQANYRAARSLLQAVGPAADNSAEANAMLGYAEYKLRDPRPAAAHLRRAIELAPKVEEYYLKMGELLLYYNSDEVAATFFKTGLQNLPDSAALHFGLAVAYWSHKIDSKGAIEHLNRALNIEPDFQSALELLCVIYHRDENWGPLQETADRLMRANPKMSTGYYFKGAALEARGRLGQEQGSLKTSWQLLEKAVRLQPQFSEMHVALGKQLVERGEVRRAIAEFQEAVKIDPNDSQGYYHLAKAYRQAGDPVRSKEALKKFSQAKGQEKDRWSWEVWFQVAK
jgi:tetratricopeptide (TPR) repeat protein